MVQAAGPAVSQPNGKIEFDAGALSMPTSFVGRVAGTLTLPLGDSFGIQADVAAGSAGGMTSSAAFHLFTRDPQSYLIGGTLGMIRMPGATVFAGGPEAELYFGRWTVEAWGGLAVVQPSSGPDRRAPFGMMDVALYPQENLRLSTGFSLLDTFGAVHFGAEYLFDEGIIPFSVTGDARLGQDGSILATVGLRGYFGAPHKSLIRRHREDDPWDRGNSLFTAIGGKTSGGSGGSVTQSGGGQGGNNGGTSDGTGDTGGTGDAGTGGTGNGGTGGTGDGGTGGTTPGDETHCEAPLELDPDGNCVDFSGF